MKKHIIYIALLACPLLPACQKVEDADRVVLASSEEVEKTSESLVLFHAASEGDASAETSTKATVVTSLTSFQASATRGSAGSETSKWNNVTFTSDGAGTPTFSGGKYWPNSDEYYHFYAANSAITFAASGSTITTTNNATDVVYAYIPSPTYKTRNTLTFKHAYARLKEVSVSAASGYTISNIDIKITPKTHGTFNMRTETWSSTVNGSTTSVANSSPGTKTNDIYLLPGSYTMTASWRAVRGDYAENFSDISASAPITIERGKMNSVDITLGGKAVNVSFSVSIAAWENNNIDMPRFEKP